MPRNCCFFRGNLTRDPVIREVAGKTVASFSVAVNGFKEGEVEYPECEAWGKTAEFVRDNVVKGDMVEVESRLRTEKWNDKTTGDPRSKPRYQVNNLDAIKLKKWGAGSASTDETDEVEDESPKKAKTKPRTKPAVEDTNDDLEDLGF